jgi:hypothetical protein
MPTVTIDIPRSLKIALDEEIVRVGSDESAYITAALAGLRIPGIAARDSD